MNERKDDIQHLLELLLVVLDGNASEQEYARLNETLRQSEVSRRIYTDFMMTYVGLNYLDGVVNLYDDEILDFNAI